MSVRVPFYCLIAISFLCMVNAFLYTFRYDSSRIGSVYFLMSMFGSTTVGLAAAIIGRFEKLERSMGDRPRSDSTDDPTERGPAKPDPTPDS